MMKVAFEKILKKKKQNQFGEITHVAEMPHPTLMYLCKYRRSGNFRVKIIVLKKFSSRLIFVG